MMDDNRKAEGTVLVIDDEPSVGGVVVDFLKLRGYRSIFCAHPREALEYAQKRAFNLAFVDVNLPDMSGMVLATKLKKSRPSGEIVFMTGYGSFENAVQAIKIGAYDYLRKPFGINELKLCLKRFQERQALKKKMALAEERYFDLVQNIPSVIWVINRDFQLEFINMACAPMLGYDPDEATNTPDWFMDRIHPEKREHIREVIRTAFGSGGSPFSVECRLKHRNGHWIHAIVKSTNPHADNIDGQTMDRLEGIIVDISDRIFFEKTLVLKEKLKTLGAVTAEVAHEIRNPLVSIGGFARRLRQRAPELPEGAIILHESERLEEILKRIAEYLEPVKLTYQECSFNHVVTDCVNLLAPEIDEQGIQCHLDLDPTLSAVQMDKDILTQISTLLIRNSTKEMNKGGTLAIRSFESEANVHLEFRNQDPTTKSRDLEDLLMPFDEDGQKLGIPASILALKNMGGLLSFTKEENDLVYRVSHPKGDQSLSEMNGGHSP